MSIVDPVILGAFLNESKETIDSLEADLTELDQDLENEELINSVFRSLHTIKGNSSFLDLDNVTSVAHEAETLLDEVRSGDRFLTNRSIELIFSVVDVLRSMIADPENLPDTSLLVQEINQHRRKSIVEEQDDISSAILQSETANLEPASTELEANKILESIVPMEQTASSTAQPKPPRASNGSTKSTDETVSRRPTANMLRIEESKIERMVSLVNELELLKYSLEQLPSQFEKEDFDVNEARLNLDLATSKVSRITSELGSLVFGARLVPVNNVFRRFPRIVRDLARKLDKEIELQVLNGSAELDKSIVEAIADPMTHLIRNAVDHGIEAPESREVNGKNRLGLVTLNSFVEGNSVVIEIKDDGKGMDPEIIVKKAIEKGIIPKGKEKDMPDSEKLGLIFAPGFSTAEQITDISGRGVGMDVVKSNINKLKGTVQIESEIGEGTTIQLKFPLSVVVARCLYVYVGETCCAIPLSQMEESIHIGKGGLYSRPPRRLKSGEETMAVYSMQDLLWGKFQIPAGAQELPAVRVRRNDGKLIALIVDDFSIMEETIIHSVDSYISSIPGIQGGVIRKDGSVTVALSLSSLLDLTVNKNPLAYTVSREKTQAETADLKKLIQEASELSGGVLDFKIS